GDAPPPKAVRNRGCALNMTRTIETGGANVLARDEQAVGRERLSVLATYCRIYCEVRSAGLACCGLLVLVLASTPIVLLTPVPLKLAVDHILLGQSIPTFLNFTLPEHLKSSTGFLFFCVGLMITIGVTGQVRQAAEWTIAEYAAGKLVSNFRSRLF